ncbi:MAG: fumarate hydrolyase [Proteobacteria bacterium]|nr:fumarate hydrolyase [Pseudomonadota bacterium]
MIRIDIPSEEDTIRALKVGDEVELFGRVVTARDAAHKFMVENWPEFTAPLLHNGAIYHSGPVMKKRGATWKVVAAGPTTSIREEPYEASVMEHYGVRIVIGKGGMGENTLAACKKLGAVYLHAIGGAAVKIADSIKRVEDVHMLDELGVPEAFWVFEVERFRGMITMDSKGRSLHKQIQRKSKKARNALLGL